jgi:hypothetical protein
VDEHIAETELSLYAFNPDALPLARQNAIDEHAAACADCRATLDFFMVTEEELRDPDVWERAAGLLRGPELGSKLCFFLRRTKV